MSSGRILSPLLDSHIQTRSYNRKTSQKYYNTDMLLKTILLTATTFTTALAVPIPLHNTNTQRLPDHPAAVNQSDFPITQVVQKHKYVPEIVAPILRLCGRSLRYTDMILTASKEAVSKSPLL